MTVPPLGCRVPETTESVIVTTPSVPNAPVPPPLLFVLPVTWERLSVIDVSLDTAPNPFTVLPVTASR